VSSAVQCFRILTLASAHVTFRDESLVARLVRSFGGGLAAGLDGAIVSADFQWFALGGGPPGPCVVSASADAVGRLFESCDAVLAAPLFRPALVLALLLEPAAAVVDIADACVRRVQASCAATAALLGDVCGAVVAGIASLPVCVALLALQAGAGSSGAVCVCAYVVCVFVLYCLLCVLMIACSRTVQPAPCSDCRLCGA
jgi:hypothetical protein